MSFAGRIKKKIDDDEEGNLCLNCNHVVFAGEHMYTSIPFYVFHKISIYYIHIY